MQNKKTKAAAARKTAEAMKAKKKQERIARVGNQAPASTMKNKGRSAIPQSKKRGK